MDTPIVKKSKITSKHQITIPREFYYLFAKSSEVRFSLEDGKLTISPVDEDNDAMYNKSVSGHPIIGGAKDMLSGEYDLSFDEESIFNDFNKEW